MIRFEIGRGTWKMFFRILIRRAVMMEVEARRIAWDTLTDFIDLVEADLF